MLRTVDTSLIVLAHHAPVHDPDPAGLAVFLLHHLDHVFDRAHVRGVAGEDLVGDGEDAGDQYS